MERKNVSANAVDANTDSNVAADLASSLSNLSINTDTSKTNADTYVGPPLDKIVEAHTVPQRIVIKGGENANVTDSATSLK